MSVPYLAQAADHEQLEWLGGGVMRILLDGKKTDGQLTMIRSAASAGSASPVHVHASEDEIIVLVKGSGIFWAGEHRYELSDGGVAFLPRGVPHAYRFTSDTVDMLAVCPPRGYRGVLPRGRLGPVPPQARRLGNHPRHHGRRRGRHRSDHPRAAPRRRPDDPRGLPGRLMPDSSGRRARRANPSARGEFASMLACHPPTLLPGLRP